MRKCNRIIWSRQVMQMAKRGGIGKTKKNSYWYSLTNINARSRRNGFNSLSSI